MGDKQIRKMRKLLKRIYLKTRIYIIILLSVVIGASYMFVYEEINDLFSDYNESMVIWNDYNRKSLGVSVSAEAHESLDGSFEEISLSPPPFKELSKELSVEDRIRKVFKKEGDIAVAVAKAESRLEPDRIGDTHMTKYSYGLFQINRTWHDYPPEILLNPDENIKIAKQIRDEGGWDRWTTYRTGQYLDFL